MEKTIQNSEGKDEGGSARSRASKFFVTFGVLFLAAALLLTGYNIWDSKRADQASRAAVEKMQRIIDEQARKRGNDAGEDGKLSDEREMPTIEIDGYRYIGYLSVPSTGQELPVMEDWDMERLRIAPCRYYGTVYKNDMVLAGHNYRSHFSPLRWLDLGTEIVFTDVENNSYHYVIDNIESLKPQQTEDMIAESEDWDLTLFTCTIGGQARYTIRCVRTDEGLQ